MLLDWRSAHDAQVLVLRGPVADADAGPLRDAVTDALHATCRGVVVDLSHAGVLSGAALDVLSEVASRSPSWPRPSVTVCGAPSALTPRLAPLLALHADLDGALAHLDDHDGDPRCREVVVEHGQQGPRQARQAVQQWSADLGLGALADDLLLIVSELVTNAVRYGAPPVRVSVTVDDRSVTVGVVDAARSLPQLRLAHDDAESGRGLLLLSLLSTEHGVRPQAPGKVVWASLRRG